MVRPSNHIAEVHCHLFESIVSSFLSGRHFLQAKCSHCTQSCVFELFPPSPSSSLLLLLPLISLLLSLVAGSGRRGGVMAGGAGTVGARAFLNREGGGERPAGLNFTVFYKHIPPTNHLHTFSSCSSCKSMHKLLSRRTCKTAVFSYFPPIYMSRDTNKYGRLAAWPLQAFVFVLLFRF